MYCGRGGSWRAGRPRPAGGAGALAAAEPLPGGEMIEAVDMDVYLLSSAGGRPPDHALPAEETETERRLLLLDGLPILRVPGRDDAPAEPAELRRHLGVVRQREWHARVERRGDRGGVGRKCVVHRIPERRLDLRGSHPGCPGPIE